MKSTLEIILFLSIFIIMYLIFSKINTDNLEKKIYRLLGDVYSKDKIESNKYEYLKKNKETIRDKLNNLIDHSDVRRIVPFLIPEILILVSIGSAILGFYILKIITSSNIFIQAEGATLGFMAPYIVLYNMQINIENSLSRETIRFINKGIGITENTNVLINILKEGTKYSNGKLKEIIDNIISSLDSGTDRNSAFLIEINKTNNRRLKELLNNIRIASNEDSSYKEVFEKAKRINENYYNIREEAEIESKKSKEKLLVGVCFAGIVLSMVFVMLKESREIILNTIQGQLSVALVGIIFIYIAYFFVKIKKFNY